MQASQVPEPLRERLGAKGTTGLLDLFDTAGREWSDDVLKMSAGTFERRLTEECSRIRVDIANLRSEIVKWAFLFWVGQFFAVASLIVVLVRFLRPAG